MDGESEATAASTTEAPTEVTTSGTVPSSVAPAEAVEPKRELDPEWAARSKEDQTRWFLVEGHRLLGNQAAGDERAAQWIARMHSFMDENFGEV